MGNAQLLLEPLLHLAIVVPMLLIFIREHTLKNYLRILTIAFCYLICYVALTLQYHFDCFNIINGNWNWDGKIYSIVCGVVFYFAFRRQFCENNFFTLRQNKDGLRAALRVAFAVIVVQTLLGALGGMMSGGVEFNLERLLFQLSMPGIDEEIMFRGVLLGLMCSALRTAGAAWRNPAIVINGVLFGLVHSLSFVDGSLQFNVAPFIWTGMIGYALSYITLRTRSILIPMLTHNLCNFFNNVASMIF